MGKVAQLWNPRGNHRLRRHWVSFEDQIIIDGGSLEQAGILSVRPGCKGQLRARLRVMGPEYEEAVSAGNDLEIWINGLKLFVGVKAVDDGHMLLAFGIQRGSKVSLTLDAGPGRDEAAIVADCANDGAARNGFGCSIGLCQTPF